MKKKETTREWRVDFQNLAYDGGGYASWTQYYRTKFGARFSMFVNLRITSYGGRATLYRVKT